MRHTNQRSIQDQPLQTQLTSDEIEELCRLARQDGWLLEAYATEILGSHLYVTGHLIEGVRH